MSILCARFKVQSKVREQSSDTIHSLSDFAVFQAMGTFPTLEMNIKK